MENVESFFNCIESKTEMSRSFSDRMRVKIGIKRNSILNIQNKLIKLTHEKMQMQYAKMIVSRFARRFYLYCSSQEFEFKEFEYENVLIVEFLDELVDTFEFCDIDLLDILKRENERSDYNINYGSLLEGKNIVQCSLSESGVVNEFTSNRKRIAIEALLSAVGKRSGATGNISSAKIQRFAYFLTGSGSVNQEINNTAISKAFKDKDRRSRLAASDNQFVAEYFRNLGLDDIATEISNGIFD